MEKTIAFRNCDKNFNDKEKNNSLNNPCTYQTKDYNINNDEFENTLEEKKVNDSNLNHKIKKNEANYDDEFLMNLRKNNNGIFFDNYEIQGIIGKGNESHVYKLYDIRSKSTFALKIILKQKGENSNNELKLLNKLKHKNLVHYLGAFEIKKDEYDCIIMNLGEFGNLINFQDNIIYPNQFYVLYDIKY